MNRRELFASLFGAGVASVQMAAPCEKGIMVIKLQEYVGKDTRESIARTIVKKVGNHWKVLVTEPTVDVEFIRE